VGIDEFASDSAPSLGRKSCRANSDCPQVNCFASPCDVNYCSTNGFCTMQSLVGDTNEDMIGSTFENGNSDISDNSDFSEGTATDPIFFEEGEIAMNSTSTGTACGAATCTGSQVCCNKSCGECAEPDEICSEELCEPDDGEVDNEGTGEVCGPSVCGVGESKSRKHMQLQSVFKPCQMNDLLHQNFIPNKPTSSSITLSILRSLLQ